MHLCTKLRLKDTSNSAATRYFYISLFRDFGYRIIHVPQFILKTNKRLNRERTCNTNRHIKRISWAGFPRQ